MTHMTDMTTDRDLQTAKAVVRSYYDALDTAEGAALEGAMADHCAPDLLWRGFHPFDEQRGPETVARVFWQPLKQALRPMRRRLDMLFAGRDWQNEETGGLWVVSKGHLMGLFDAPWLGIRPTRKLTMLHFSAFHRVENGRIVDEAMYVDIPHLMIQAGQNPFPPQTGAHLVQPGPVGHDAILWDPQDPEEGRRTAAAIQRMVNDLKNWKSTGGPELEEELRRSWTEDMVWWGPAGIGATFTIPRYAEQHAGPFRRAFADRRSNGHVARVAEGPFGGFFGWPSLTLTPTGGFMGMPGTGKPGELRVIDLYRREGDKLAENWIFLDVLHFWKQQGVDVLGRMEGIG